METTTTDWKIQAVIKKVLAESDAAEPAVLAVEVFNAVPHEMYGEALRQCLPTIVTQALTRRTMLRTDGGEPRSGHDNQSSRWQRTEEALRYRLFVDGEWLLIEDVTAADFDWAAADRQERAKQHAAKARYFQRCASIIRGHDPSLGVTVGDLPEELQAEIVGGFSHVDG